MIFPSDLLSIFRRHDGTQVPADGQLQVPNVLQPVIAIPEVLRVATDAAAAEALTSTSCHQVWTVANAALDDRELIRLFPGVWRVFITMAYFANFTNSADKGEVYLNKDDTNTATTIWRTWAVTSDQQAAQVTFDFAHDDARGISINGLLTANGVGESHTLDVGIFANRLG